MARTRIGRAGLPILTVVICAFIVLPLAVVIAFSVTTSPYVVFPPTGFSLRWYQQVLSSQEYIGSLVLSLQITVGVLGLVFLLGFPAALGLARGQFRGREALTYYVMSPILVPTVVFGLAALQFYPDLGLPGATTPIVIGHSVWILPVVVRYITASLLSADLDKMEQAAATLGARPFWVTMRITLPAIRPGMAAAGLMAFALSFDEAVISLFLSTPNATPLPVRILGQVQSNPGDTFTAAVGTVVLLISLGVAAIVEKIYGLERALIGRGGS